jgi:hypothetical protein
MVNPTIITKTEGALTIAENTKKLFQDIYREQRKEEPDDDEVPKIRVSEFISKMAFYYEKIRYAVDYKEEHLLRKNAIERIIKRQIIIEGKISLKEIKSEEVAKHLLTELIRAGYLPNNKVPETKIDEISQVIDKYLKLKNYSLEHFKNDHQEKTGLVKWIIALAASDIEERLGRNKVDMTVISYMNEILKANIKLPSDSPFEQDREIQIYTGIHRSLLRFDRDMLSFILFRHFNADWQNPTEETIEKIAKEINHWQETIDNQIDHPLTGQLNRIISRYTSFFTILTDVIAEDPEGVYGNIKRDPKAFPRRIKRICNSRYKQAKTKLWRSAVRSIIYIFITKSVFAIILEVPATKWFGEEINSLSLAVNITCPALLLFLIVLFTKLPSTDNTNKITEGINEIVFVEHKRQEPFRLHQPAKRGKFLNTIFGIIYTITFFLSFGLTIWVLDKIEFSWVSIIIFLFFLAFASFFSIRIRKNAKELIIVESKENIFTFIVDFFYVPVVSAGKWLSEKFSRINVFVFILDFIIEAPFKIFVEIAEEWTKYVRERKDEIV